MYYQDPSKVQSNHIDTRTYVLHKGDIAFEGHKNKNYSFGRFVENDIGNGVISELFPIYKHITNYDLLFWKYKIHIESLMHSILAKSIASSGTSSNKLVKKDFLKQIINVPSIYEQEKIGLIVNKLDRVISLYQQKIPLLKQLKQGMLQKLFTGSENKQPILRFNGYHGDWEQRKLREVAILNGRIGFRGYTRNDIVDKEEGVLAFSPTNIIANKLVFTDKDTYISKLKYEESPEIMLRKGFILFVKTGSTLGKSAIIDQLNEPATVNPQIVVIKPHQTDPSFLSFILINDSIQRQVQATKIGGAVPTLTESTLKEMYFDTPSLREQQQISKLMDYVSSILTLYQNKINTLTNLKKFLLQQMFI